MDEQIRIILIIIISVSIFGLLVFVFVKNYIRNKINFIVEENQKNKKKDNNWFLFYLAFRTAKALLFSK